MIRRWLVFVCLILLLNIIACDETHAFSVQKEIDLGREASKEVIKEMPLSKNEKWQKDIDEMGQRFMPHIQRKEFKYEFHIIEAKDEVNAFALPGGYVFFTERIWRIMTPDERAAIMAHEITHCDQRHGIDMMIKSEQRSLWMLPVIILGGGTGLAQAAMWGNVMIAQRYSRKMEKEADEMGVKLCAAAGYNPAAAVTSMEKLLSIETDENHYEFSAVFASHPETIKRIEYLKQNAASLGASESEMKLKAVDDPARLGNITAKYRDYSNVVSARTSTPLIYGQSVLIKKMLWDDEAQVLAPKTVAAATVLAPGTLPILVIKSQENYSTGDVMEGDGVYPMPQTPLDLPVVPSTPNGLVLETPK